MRLQKEAGPMALFAAQKWGRQFSDTLGNSIFDASAMAFILRASTNGDTAEI